MSEAYTSSRDGDRGRRKRTGDIVPGTPAQARELRAQGPQDDAPTARRRHARVRRARFPCRACRRHRARRAHVARHVLPLLREQGRPAPRARNRVRDRRWTPSPTGSGRSVPTPRATPSCARSSTQFFTTYRRYGPIIRAWMEGHVDDRARQRARREGVHRHRDRARQAHARGRRAGRRRVDLGAHGAARTRRLLPRVASSRVRQRRDPRHAHSDVHRGFFAAAAFRVRGAVPARRATRER